MTLVFLVPEISKGKGYRNERGQRSTIKISSLSLATGAYKLLELGGLKAIKCAPLEPIKTKLK